MSAELIATLEERAATYGLLARLFNREIDEDLLENLGSLPLGGETPAGSPCEGARLMQAYLDASGSDAITELAVDFARLFIVRTAHTKNASYPFESVYTSTDRTIMGDARDRVLAAYRSEGLDKSPSWKLAEDHVSLELEFEQLLCSRAGTALADGNEAEGRRLLVKQREFLDDHLLVWTPMFAEAMQVGAKTDFYRGLGSFLLEFLQDDRKHLAEIAD